MTTSRSPKRGLISLLIMGGAIFILQPVILCHLITPPTTDPKSYLLAVYVVEITTLSLYGGLMILPNRWLQETNARFEAIIATLTADDARVKLNDVSTEPWTRIFTLADDSGQSILVTRDRRDFCVTMSARGDTAEAYKQQVWAATDPQVGLAMSA